jgi:hypothetical protein
MPTMHDAKARSGLKERVRRVRVDSVRQWGRMTPDQMLWHVNAQLEVALGHRPCGPLDNLFKRTVFKAVALYGPWPKGKAPTAPEMRATASYDLEAERSRFEGLADEFAARKVEGEWVAHPAFGRLTGAQWSLLAWRHADHHLRQFSV